MNWNELVPGPVTPEGEVFLREVATDPRFEYLFMQSQEDSRLTYQAEALVGFGVTDPWDPGRSAEHYQAVADKLTDKLGVPRTRVDTWRDAGGQSYTVRRDLVLDERSPDNVVAHELAHYLVGEAMLAEGASPLDAYASGHGPEFRATYLDVLGEMDLLEAALLRHMFDFVGAKVGQSAIDRSRERVAA